MTGMSKASNEDDAAPLSPGPYIGDLVMISGGGVWHTFTWTPYGSYYMAHIMVSTDGGTVWNWRGTPAGLAELSTGAYPGWMDIFNVGDKVKFMDPTETTDVSNIVTRTV